MTFVKDFHSYVSMYFDFETVNIDNMKINKLGRVSTEYEQDRVFIGVFVFFRERETKMFYINWGLIMK